MRWIFIIAAFLSLSACQTPPEARRFPELTWAHVPPFSFKVGRVVVMSDYHAPMAPPNVEHLFPVSIEGSALRWGEDRIKAVGGKGVVKYTVKQARAVEVPLEKTKGLKGEFTTDQSERYELYVEVAIEVVGAEGEGLKASHVEANAKRFQTVAENASVDDREKIWFTTTEALMKDLNTELEARIPEYFAMHLAR